MGPGGPANLHYSGMNLWRLMWLVLGLTFTGLGFLGMVIPGLPTTICLIIAVACFSRSHRGFELWLLNHKWFGAQLRDWEQNKWISARVKAISCSAIVFFTAFSLFVIPPFWVKGVVAALAVIGVVFILTRPTRPLDAPYPGPINPDSPLDWREDPSRGPLEPILEKEPPRKVIASAGSKPDSPGN